MSLYVALGLTKIQEQVTFRIHHTRTKICLNSGAILKTFAVTLTKVKFERKTSKHCVKFRQAVTKVLIVYL